MRLNWKLLVWLVILISSQIGELALFVVLIRGEWEA